MKHTQIKSLCDWLNEIEEEIEINKAKIKDNNHTLLVFMEVNATIVCLEQHKQRLQSIIDLAQIK